MKQEDIILQIYGKVSATETNVAHILSHQKTTDDKVEALHKRVDCNSKKISYGLGAAAMIGVFAKMVWEWVRERI